MFLSKRKNGYYYLWFVSGGKKKKVSCRTKKKPEAIAFLRDFRLEHFEQENQRKEITCRDFFDEFLEFSKTIHTEKTQRHFQTAFNEWVRLVGNLPLHQVGVREVENFLSQKTTEASTASARKYFIALSSAFSTGVRWGYLHENIWKKVRKPKPPEKDPIFFPKEHLRHLLSIIDDPDFLDIVLYAVNTGCRLGEILSVEWNDLDFDRRVIQVRNKDGFTTKSKKNRIVPMNQAMHDLLMRRRLSTTCSFVFHRDGRKILLDTVSMRFKKYVRVAGKSSPQDADLWERYHFHHLRATFTVYLLSEKVSIWEISKLLGHSSVAVTEKHYSGLLNVDGLHESVNKISF